MKYIYLAKTKDGDLAFSSYKKAHRYCINSGYIREYDDGTCSKFVKGTQLIYILKLSVR